MTEPTEPTWFHCNSCGRDTKHTTLCRAQRDRRFYDPNSDPHPVDTSVTWTVLQCMGCEEVSMTQRVWDSEMPNWEDPDVTVFPPRFTRSKPNWAQRHFLSNEYRGLLDEVYLALHADSKRLATMGARALLDAFITKHVGDRGNFPEGLKALVQEHYLSEREKDLVAAAIDLGNASAHRGHVPSAHDLNTVIDIVENLIHKELLMPQAHDLQARTPPRPTRVRKKKTT